MIRLPIALALLALVVSLVACDKTDDARCQELDEILEAKASQAPNTCEEDIDCLIVQIHPGLSVAANAPVFDAEIDTVKSRRIELCDDFEEDLSVYQAVCVESVCALEVTGMVDPPPDATPDPNPTPNPEPTPDAGMCNCTSDADCGFGALCPDGCTCEPLCDVVCIHADECGKLEELRLGSDIPNCITRCDGFLEREGQNGLTLLTCLATTPCATLESCLQ